MSLISSLNISTDKKIYIFQGTHGKFYRKVFNLNEESDKRIINYDIHFPVDWTFNEEALYQYNGKVCKTGPEDCFNCRNFGYYNGVFISYCMNCAGEFDKYYRGNGMIEEGVEINEEMEALDLSNFNKETSIWNTYLKDVTLNEIGDVGLKEYHDMYKDLPDLLSPEEENYDNQFSDEEYNYSSDDEKKVNRETDKWLHSSKARARGRSDSF
jgi:hypothetical protein